MKKREAIARDLREGRLSRLGLFDAIMEVRLPKAPKFALLAIVSHWSRESPKPTVGVRRLADLAALKTDTVLTGVNALEQLGLIRVERSHRQSHIYDLSGLAEALLRLPPFASEGTDAVPNEGTDAVPNEGTDAVPNEGTDAVPNDPAQLSQKQDPTVPKTEFTVPKSGSDCPNPGIPRISEEREEGISRRNKAEDKPRPFGTRIPSSDHELDPKSEPAVGAESFTLTPPDGGQGSELPAPPKPKRQRKLQPGAEPPDPNVNVLDKHWESEHKRLRGGEPKRTRSQHGAARKAWKDLLSLRTVDHAQRIITRALQQKTAWCDDPTVILKKQNQFADDASTQYAAPRRPREWVQGGGASKAASEAEARARANFGE